MQMCVSVLVPINFCEGNDRDFLLDHFLLLLVVITVVGSTCLLGSSDVLPRTLCNSLT